MADDRARNLLQRIVAGGALLAAMLVVLYLVVVAPGSSYTVHARFTDAGQLVPGDLVEVGGRQVGTISHLGLTPDGQADLTLSIDEGELVPLHEGTTATIREVGLVTITNRYVELGPGPPNTPAVPDGGVIAEQYTHGIVDPDVLLDSLDPPTLRNLVSVIDAGAGALAPPTAQQLRRAVAYLDPALGQTAAFAHEATLDRPALSALLNSAASVSAALASRLDALTGVVHSTAAALDELAAQRAAVGDILDRAPGLLQHADRTLAAGRSALARLDPLLVDLRPVAPPAAHLLQQLVPVLDNTAPALAQIRALIPRASAVLSKLPAVTRRAVPAIGAAGRALAAVLSILTALRAYTPDLVAGFFNGFGGNNAGYYDANGHYARIALELGSGGQTGVLSSVPPPQPPGANGYRTGLTARCPGGASEPAAAGANPWPLSPLCDPAQDQR